MEDQERIKRQEQKIKELKKGPAQEQSDFIGSARYNQIAENIARRGSGTKENIDTIMEELEREVLLQLLSYLMSLDLRREL